MAKLGEDWVFIGLGLGAVYLVYKLTKPVTDLVQGVSDLGTNVTDTASDILDTVSSPFTLTPSSNGEVNNFPSVSDYLFKSPLVTVPATVKATSSLFSKSSSRSNSSSYTPVVNPQTTRQKTNIALSQGLVSVAPPKMSVVSGAKVSPFTGQYYR